VLRLRSDVRLLHVTMIVEGVLSLGIRLPCTLVLMNGRSLELGRKQHVLRLVWWLGVTAGTFTYIHCPSNRHAISFLDSTCTSLLPTRRPTLDSYIYVLVSSI
jgi:hypothetical protein